MGRLTDRFARVDRLLVLGEELLRRLLGAAPDPELFTRHTAFRFEPAAGGGRLVPIRAPQGFDLDDLVGVGDAVALLSRNTEQFVRGLPSNHVLLYGERGTGKSSAVRGLLSRFAGQGLRVVEVRKHDLIHLPLVLELLRDAPHRFLLFCDDLSFDAGEAGMRELKAALEGSFEAPSPNVRVIATSNRRHLLPETLADNAAARLDEHGDLHPGETAEEKLALSDRFGLTIGFFGFDQATYLAIVERWADKAGIDLPRAELHARALRFATRRASRSGRTARQFVDDLAGQRGLQR
jgi:predicted AAA+ superfamily ATPase